MTFSDKSLSRELDHVPESRLQEQERTASRSDEAHREAHLPPDLKTHLPPQDLIRPDEAAAHPCDPMAPESTRPERVRPVEAGSANSKASAKEAYADGRKVGVCPCASGPARSPLFLRSLSIAARLSLTHTPLPSFSANPPARALTLLRSLLNQSICSLTLPPRKHHHGEQLIAELQAERDNNRFLQQVS